MNRRNRFTILMIFVFLFDSIQSKEPLSLKMEEIEEIALTNSIILASLKDRREVFKMMATERWRNYLPRVGLSYFGLRNANMNQPDTQYNDIRIQMNQLLYDGGENALEIESARLSELLNHEDWKIAREKLLLEVRKAYIRSISTNTKTQLAMISYERALKHLNEAKSERREGFISELQLQEIANKLYELELFVLRSKSQSLQNQIDLKKQMNLPLEEMIVFNDSLIHDFILFPPQFLQDDEGQAVIQRPEIKKSKIAIENLKTRKEISENYWKPKMYLGGYYGENVNGSLPVKNEVYGFNVSIQTQIGSSTNQTSANYGIQTDGTGIQRIPGFGPQFVGRGENAFNSNTLNLFDDLSYSRKIYEGKVALSDAIRSNQFLEISIGAEAFKAKERVRETWLALSLQNSKFIQSYQTWKVIRTKHQQGLIKDLDLLGAEVDLVKAVDELSIAIANYLESGMEYSYATSVSMDDLNFFKIQKGKGNSVMLDLFSFDPIEQINHIQSQNKDQTEKTKIGKRNDYQFFLED